MSLQIAPRPSAPVPKPTQWRKERNQAVAKEKKKMRWKKRWYKQAQRVQVAQYMWHYLVQVVLTLGATKTAISLALMLVEPTPILRIGLVG
jgi:hypothetical protein